MKKPTQIFHRLLAMALCFCSMQAFAQSPSNMITYAGYGINSLHGHMMLSDSTWLVGGEASDLTLIPSTVNVVTLDTAGFDLRASANTNTAVVLHISKDMQTLVNVVAFPANTVGGILKIRTTTAPGQPTGMLYISGDRDDGSNSRPGYYIARLNNNFVNGVPTTLASYIDVNARSTNSGKHDFDGPSWHRVKQPWDVDSKGTVYYATGRDFAFDWSQITVADSMGNPTGKPGFTRLDIRGSFNGSTTYVDTTATPGVVKDIEYTVFGPAAVGDSVMARFQYGSNNVFRKVEVTDVLASYIILKVTATEARPFRSVSLADYNQLSSDGNGGQVRGKYPLDYLYEDPCISPDVQGCLSFVSGPGFSGYSISDLYTARVGDVTVDRTNDHMYFGFTDIPYNSQGLYVGTADGFNYGTYDYNSFLVGLDNNGYIKWWNRMHEEDTFGTGFTANQFVNNLEIDYTNNQVVALNYAVGTSDHVFFNGDNVAANPSASGFLNDFNGVNANIRYSWVGKFATTDGQFQRATYIADYGASGYNGAALTDPNLDGWANPALGTPNYASTNCEGLSIAANGDVCVTCTGTRPITTRNAYQRMYKADRDTDIDSASTRNNFVRVYSQDLDTVKYSSVLTGIWNPANGFGGNNVTMVHATAYADKAVVTGSHSGLSLPGPAI